MGQWVTDHSTWPTACSDIRKTDDNNAYYDTFLQFSVKLVGDATSLYRRYERTDFIRLVRDDLAANNLHTKTVACTP